MKLLISIPFLLFSLTCSADYGPSNQGITKIIYPKQRRPIIIGSTLAGALIGNLALASDDEADSATIVNATIVGAGIGGLLSLCTTSWLFEPEVRISKNFTSVSFAYGF